MEVRDDSYELFHRAVVERDADAWATLAARYRNLMISWAAHCPAIQGAHERSEDLADRALARAWAALSPGRFAAFPNTAALLGYLRSCVTATVIDAARAQTAHARAACQLEQAAVPTPEQATIERSGRDELWRLVSRMAVTEAERVALVERFVLDLPPRAIQARHPALFADVTVVYASIRNLCDRLRRNPDFRQFYNDRRAS
jgi:DNA-directed RNA polymerase specialized sigma24 family protein